MLSAKGKKPSDASTAPRRSWPARFAFITATSTASTRLVCPEPSPISAVPRARATAFERAAATTSQAKRSAAISSALGEWRVTPFHAGAASRGSRCSSAQRPTSRRLHGSLGATSCG